MTQEVKKNLSEIKGNESVTYIGDKCLLHMEIHISFGTGPYIAQTGLIFTTMLKVT